jgi:NADPH-dependent ferric siderophore reductase
MNDLSPNKQTAAGVAPRIERVRHELRRRELTVTSVETLTPNMLRLTLTGDDLADFTSASPDDHVKIFLPTAGAEPESRDYTPRRFSAEGRELVLDFAVHDAGPATAWALQAQPGNTLLVGGPRGSAVVSGVKRWLLVGDETALPAIGRRIEETHDDDIITVIAAVSDRQDEQSFRSHGQLNTVWVHRPLAAAADAAPLLAALEKIDIAPETFAWIAAEASVARAVRTYLTQERDHPLAWLKAAGYWLKGQADAHEKIE